MKWRRTNLRVIKVISKRTPPHTHKRRNEKPWNHKYAVVLQQSHIYNRNYLQKIMCRPLFQILTVWLKKKNPCSHVPNNQTRDKDIPVWPSNPQRNPTGSVSQRPWQQQCCLVIWLRDKANTSSRVKWQKSLALWNARVGQTNCEAVRPNHSASGTVIFHGPAEDTCATSRGTEGCVGSRVSVISI